MSLATPRDRCACIAAPATTPSEQYARAREDGYFSKFEEMYAIATGCEPTNAEVQKAKLIVDVLKWQLSKALPKQYGERVNLAHTGADGGPIRSENIDPRDLARSVLDVLAEAGDTSTELEALDSTKH
jgi:hypothetical protein